MAIQVAHSTTRVTILRLTHQVTTLQVITLILLITTVGVCTTRITTPRVIPTTIKSMASLGRLLLR